MIHQRKSPTFPVGLFWISIQYYYRSEMPLPFAVVWLKWSKRERSYYVEWVAQQHRLCVF